MNTIEVSEQNELDYSRIAKAIEYLQENFKDQPDLDTIAEKVHLSPFHFQRLFQEWAGVSPKKFLQYISVEHAKQLLKTEATLFDATYKTGLSSTGRLHDLFVKIEGMTPGEFKKGGESLSINYSYHSSVFGDVLIASTYKGVCYMGFVDNKESAFKELKDRFPNATYKNETDSFQWKALNVFDSDWNKPEEIKLHLKGSEFQLKVWESLLKIPNGSLSTYGKIAQNIDRSKAARAVGTAIGSNPVGFIIPCHRVIKSSGIIGGYMWGSIRKTAIIGWESATVLRLKKG